MLLGDSGGNSGLRQVVQTTRWTPALGGEELSRRYRQALGLPAAAAYPVQPPGASTLGAWSDFSLATLGFVPSATAASLPRWQDFLERRYGTAGRFQAAYAAAGASPAASFAAIPLPAVLPKDGAPLLDWFQFEGIVLQVARSAHRFTVLLKAPDNDFSGDKHRALQLLATRVVNLQKPAHTTFDVKFFWQMFQLGAARLGADTLLDQPRGLPAMRLGQGYAGESYLSPNFPQDASSRQVLGRDPISSQNTSWQEGTS